MFHYEVEIYQKDNLGVACGGNCCRVCSAASVFAAFATAPSSIGTGNYYITNAKTGVRLVLSGNKDADGTAFKAANASSIDVSQVMRITKKAVTATAFVLPKAQRARLRQSFPAERLQTAHRLLFTAITTQRSNAFIFTDFQTEHIRLKTAANTSLLLTASGKNVNLKSDNTKDPASQQWNLENFVLKGAGTDPDGKLPYGVDVSEHQSWQKQINWEAAKNYGVKFAIIRLGYGDNLANQDDRAFSYNVSECRRLGIPFGVYIYSYAENTKQAKSEAAHCLRLVKGLPLSYPIYYDLEDPDTTAKCSNAEILKNRKDFLKRRLPKPVIRLAFTPIPIGGQRSLPTAIITISRVGLLSITPLAHTKAARICGSILPKARLPEFTAMLI